ncbi:MAG: serine/threonine protein kinase [Sandaracinaceae bacterium]|nr:serine/threonine protein kinase [Sandaracinaceae bacterium]
MPVLMPEERVGTLIADKYRLDAILGAGGMGVVFAGHHEWTSRDVAVKLLKPEYAQFADAVHRFMQEARAAARLRTPHVVDVLDMGREQDGTVYMVLERLHGEPLSDRLERVGKLGVAEAVATLGPVMEALIQAHAAGIVHRDLKPDNIYLSVGPDDKVVPKLLDFGVAKVSAASKNTTTGTMLGTPHYMSPEQVRGESDVGPPADIWSMGVVLYECLSGRLPYPGESTTGVLTSILINPPVPLSAVAPEVPPAVIDLVEMALRHDIADRPPTMEAFLRRLRAIADPMGVVDTLRPPPVDARAATQVAHKVTPVAEVAAREPAKRRGTVGLPGVQPEPSEASFQEVPTPIVDSLEAPFPLTETPRARMSELPSPPLVSRVPLVVGAIVLALLAAGIGGWMALGDDAPADVAPTITAQPAAASPAAEPAPSLEPPPAAPPLGADVPADLAPLAAAPIPQPALEPAPASAPEPAPERTARPHRPPAPVPVPVVRPLPPAPFGGPPSAAASAPPPTPRPTAPAVGANNAPILEIE